MPAKKSRKASAEEQTPVTDYRYPTEQRKDIPPAGVGIQGKIQEEAKIRYEYDPHRPPVLRFNEDINRHKTLLEKATKASLTQEEAAELAAMLESPQPWLEWAAKRENPTFDVDPVALHIHERVSAQAILKAVRREDAQRDLFGEKPAPEGVPRAYYQHDVDWANRLILGDSLQVMTSLARREALAGKVQMIYFDPPYGISFSSNWQNEVGKRDVKETNEDLSREPEMIKAYRDTWMLGVHSYLAYLKQRLVLARELLAPSGSLFLQISDENLHRVRALADEVFGPENFCVLIKFVKTSGKSSTILAETTDYLLWYAKDITLLKHKPLYQLGGDEETPSDDYDYVELASGGWAKRGQVEDSKAARFYKLDDSSSQGETRGERQVFVHEGRSFNPTPGRHFSQQLPDGMNRLAAAGMLQAKGERVFVKNYADRSKLRRLSSSWDDTQLGGFRRRQEKLYVVQTAELVVTRCLLMATEPGDLVLDPTCGSGTTAFVCEQWGRRWITIDTSRVAVATARQRLLTAHFAAYKTRDPLSGVSPASAQNPRHGFICRTAPKMTFKSIAQNKGLDAIFAKHATVVADRLTALNRALSSVDERIRAALVGKLIAKIEEEGYRSVTDADRRVFLLPCTSASLLAQRRGVLSATHAKSLRDSIPPEKQWREWEVPFDVDSEWPKPLQEALFAYRKAWRDKMDEVDAAISANAEQEDLVDQPETVRGVTRVSGPFTVESVRPMEEGPVDAGAPDSPIGGAPEQLEAGFEDRVTSSSNAASHIDRMVALLRSDGVTFLGNKHVKFDRLDPLDSSVIHAEGEIAMESGDARRVAVVIGPEVGSMPRIIAEEAIELSKARRYNEVILAAFSFDAAAQAHVHDQNEKRRIRLEGKWKPEEVGPQVSMALIRPDVVLGELLKGNKASHRARGEQLTQQIFTVFGQPRTNLKSTEDSLYQVEMEGVDIYDPVTNAIIPTNADKVAAWFVDTDYDGRTFCICQAFFPDKNAWSKLSAALKAEIPEEIWSALAGTESLPFHLGEHKSVAVKVIDPRGNEVIRVHRVNVKG
jgi:adenine-specific DNA-methyltransferase